MKKECMSSSVCPEGCDYKRRYRTTIYLSPHTRAVLDSLRAKNKRFDLSSWVNRHILAMANFEKKGALQAELFALQKERDRVVAVYEAKIRALVGLIRNG